MPFLDSILGGVKMNQYDKITMLIMLGMSIISLTGCQYNKATQYVHKETGQIECNIRTHLDCYLKDVREAFNNGSDPSAQEYKSHFRVVHTDGRSFFSYWAEYFFDNGRWLHGGEVIKVGTIDVRTGKKLTIDDVIPKDRYSEARERVRNAVVEKIGGEKNLMPSANEVLASLPENFYVGKDGLHFVFAEYSVAPYHYAPDMYGPVEVVIPAYGKFQVGK